MFEWKELGQNAVIGYVSSWVYFFVTLRPLQQLFGRMKGAFINYWMSWVVWIGVTAFLQIYNPAGETLK